MGMAENKPTCSTCEHFAPLTPGHAAICFEKWKGLPWNAAVPLTTADGWCEKHHDILSHCEDVDSPFDFESDPLRERS